MSEKQRKVIWLISVILVAVFMILIGWLIGVPMIRLVEEPDKFRIWVDSFGIWGRMIFVAMVVFQVLVAFIPGEPIELAAGYAFGFAEGTLLTLVGFLIGSWLVFVLVRRLGVKLMEVFFSKNKIAELQFLQDSKRTEIIAFILMLIPGTPKDFLSYFAGLTNITLRKWLVIVAIGRLPSLITSTATGSAAGEERYILSAIILALTIALSAIGLLYYRKLTKMEQETTDPA